MNLDLSTISGRTQILALLSDVLHTSAIFNIFNIVNIFKVEIRGTWLTQELNRKTPAYSLMLLFE